MVSCRGLPWAHMTVLGQILTAGVHGTEGYLIHLRQLVEQCDDAERLHQASRPDHWLSEPSKAFGKL